MIDDPSKVEPGIFGMPTYINKAMPDGMFGVVTGFVPSGPLVETSVGDHVYSMQTFTIDRFVHGPFSDLDLTCYNGLARERHKLHAERTEQRIFAALLSGEATQINANTVVTPSEPMTLDTLFAAMDAFAAKKLEADAESLAKLLEAGYTINISDALHSGQQVLTIATDNKDALDLAHEKVRKRRQARKELSFFDRYGGVAGTAS